MNRPLFGGLLVLVVASALLDYLNLGDRIGFELGGYVFSFAFLTEIGAVALAAPLAAEAWGRKAGLAVIILAVLVAVLEIWLQSAGGVRL